MNKTLLLSIMAVVVVVGGGAFYGGMKYAQSRNPRGQFSRADLQNLSSEERQQRLQELGVNGGAGFRGGAGGGQRGGGGFTSGEIISKDDKSVTIKLRDGGSKIIFFSDSTEISKSAEGTSSDLEVGKSITVNGVANSDGSVTAETIQL
ncbi:MAG: hypothetical protein UX07_C0011G0003 [Parcubacteria group bacterium GW2011_GWA2_45_30]|nr:MAG: hypothetical protein UX07_C0011G0003 [Parcubacteria group bacterium GW2011_GWA2_45_30]